MTREKIIEELLEYPKYPGPLDDPRDLERDYWGWINTFEPTDLENILDIFVNPPKLLSENSRLNSVSSDKRIFWSSILRDILRHIAKIDFPRYAMHIESLLNVPIQLECLVITLPWTAESGRYLLQMLQNRNLTQSQIDVIVEHIAGIEHKDRDSLLYKAKKIFENESPKSCKDIDAFLGSAVPPSNWRI